LSRTNSGWENGETETEKGDEHESEETKETKENEKA
jgi:hypothetical protein